MPSLEIEEFIAHWAAANPSERANSQAFLLEPGDLLEVPFPQSPECRPWFLAPRPAHKHEQSVH